MKYFTKPVAYLQDQDFNNDGVITNPSVPTDTPVVIMIMASYCSHCHNAMSAFQQFAEKHQGRVFTACIQGDGTNEGEQALAKRWKNIDPQFKGYPSFALFMNGKFVTSNISGRALKNLEEFAGVM